MTWVGQPEATLLFELEVTGSPQNELVIPTAGFPSVSIRIEINNRGTDVSNAMTITFNNDSSVIYSSSYFGVSATVVLSGSSADGINQAFIRGLNVRPVAIPGYQTAVYELLEWHTTNRFTQIIGRGFHLSGGGTADVFDTSIAGQWASDAAVTTIEFAALSGDFNV